MNRIFLASFLVVASVLAPWASSGHSVTAIQGSRHAPEAETSWKKLWEDLLAGNKRFMAGRPMHHELVSTRKELSKGQHPRVAVLGCADSRLSPELIFDKNLGDLFVIRSAGHIADASAIGSLEYAVEHLGVVLLVVLGHEKCGAVAAASEGQAMPTKSLQYIVDKIGQSFGEMRQTYSVDELKSLGVPMNVYHAAKTLLSESSVLKTAVEKRALKIVPGVYRLESGEVVPLQD